MVHINVICDGKFYARLPGTKAIVDLLSVALRECYFIKTSHTRHNCPFDKKAEAVQEWNSWEQTLREGIYNLVRVTRSSALRYGVVNPLPRLILCEGHRLVRRSIRQRPNNSYVVVALSTFHKLV